VLEQEVVSPPAAIVAALELAPDDAAVRIVRLRLARETPLLLETSHIPLSRCPGLEYEDLERQSLYTLLDLRYGHRPMMARQTIEATTASAFESDLLNIPEGAPLLLLEGVTATDRGVPIEWFQALYRADRVKITLESRRESRFSADTPPLSVTLT
jgi:GntR family transcriptional regulator